MTPSQLSDRREPKIERMETEDIKVDLKLVGQSQLTKKPERLKLQDILGQRATTQLQRRILPHLRWNQEIWGEAIREHLTPTTRWLDSGCG